MATWATSTCTMADGKQAAWATMLSAEDKSDADGSGNSNGSGNQEEATSPPHQPPTSAARPSTATAILTGSDLVKGGEAPVLLACDSLGRVGLLRYPAQLPPPELALAAAAATPLAAADAAADARTAEGGAVSDGANGAAAAGDVPSPEETAAMAEAAADAMARAIEAAVPRVSIFRFAVHFYVHSTP